MASTTPLTRMPGRGMRMNSMRSWFTTIPEWFSMARESLFLKGELIISSSRNGALTTRVRRIHTVAVHPTFMRLGGGVSMEGVAPETFTRLRGHPPIRCGW